MTGNKFTSSVNDILIGLMFYLQLVSLQLSAPRQVDIEALDVLERSLLKTTVTACIQHKCIICYIGRKVVSISILKYGWLVGWLLGCLVGWYIG